MKDLESLHPVVGRRAVELQDLVMCKLGIRTVIVECLRTDAEQKALFAQGRKSLTVVNRLRFEARMPSITDHQNWSKVTKVQTVDESFHGYGLAFDLAVASPHTGRVIRYAFKSDWENSIVDAWDNIGEVGLSIGLDWGGQWTAFPNKEHFQLTFGRTIASLKKERELSKVGL